MASGVGQWPAVTYETLDWDDRYPAGLASRSEIRRHRGPYEAAVAVETASLELVLPGAVAAEAADAAAELSRFDAEMGGEIAPFGAVLLRSESAASSQIENLTASARAIAEAEIGLSGRRNAGLIVANTRAMEAAIRLAERLDETSILEMHQSLLEASTPEIAGKWRREAVWIGGGSLGPHRAMFVPPQHSRVSRAIDDLVRFMDRDDLPVLPHVAVAHAQFETIHPFPDGNGRTGRALVQAMLRNKALTRNVTVPVSAGLLADTAQYFDALTAYRNGDPAPIVSQFTTASFAAIDNGRRLVTELRAVRSGWDDQVKARSDAKAWLVADLLLRHPVINAALVASELEVHLSNVYRQLDPLVAAGVLTEFTDQKRNRVWRAPEVLKALDGFAARAGRRSRA